MIIQYSTMKKIRTTLLFPSRPHSRANKFSIGPLQSNEPLVRSKQSTAANRLYIHNRMHEFRQSRYLCNPAPRAVNRERSASSVSGPVCSFPPCNYRPEARRRIITRKRTIECHCARLIFSYCLDLYSRVTAIKSHSI